MSLLDRVFNMTGISAPAPTEPAYCRHLRQHDFEAAIVPLCEALGHEDPVAMTTYASLLALGRGVEQDSTEAATWFRRAAVLGNTEGQVAFGACLASGIGVPRNDDEAAYWLYQAAKKNHCSAADLLASVVLRNPAVIGKHFTPEQFHQILKNAHRPDRTTRNESISRY